MFWLLVMVENKESPRPTGTQADSVFKPRNISIGKLLIGIRMT